ncbi:hypothetical protein HBA54_05895 [Pelagibius litoralis]|uniref:Uncharacterized protein n=1 Tax=Pelagibius litoralis TaxID=374515 RepID=A0A967EWS5_9PROT|nr:hypothetical protein [Pelagibius litoralis]NIA68118.1 hypothetical protein [Pelagibius litoralis]
MTGFPPARLFAVFLVALTWIGTALPLAAQDASGFVAGVADLPLMPGLEEMPDSGLIFDKPGGRIVEAYAAGPVSEGQVMSFYDKTLPELGWQRGADGDYLREGERLQLTLTGASGGVTVQFRLSPQ